MKKYRSNFDQKVAHPNVGFWIDDAAGFDAGWLLSYFESEVGRGRVFRPGEIVQIGWMILMVKGGECGDLELWEPHFDSIPIQWKQSVNNTFRHLTLQKSVCEQFGVEPSFPSLRQAGIASPGFLSASSGFIMSRDEPEENDSGWVFYGCGHEESTGEFRSLYDISFHQSSVIPFLALPAGAKVIHTGSDIEVSFRGSSLSSASNELLRQLLQMEVFV